MQVDQSHLNRPKQPEPDPQPDEGGPDREALGSSVEQPAAALLGASEPLEGRPRQPGKDKSPSPRPPPKG
jgi:hypothetical protein